MKERICIRQAGRGVLRRAMLFAGGLSAWGVTLASAQQTIAPPEESKPILQLVCIAIFSGLCVAIAFKNPKRTHMS